MDALRKEQGGDRANLYTEGNRVALAMPLCSGGDTKYVFADVEGVSKRNDRATGPRLLTEIFHKACHTREEEQQQPKRYFYVMQTHAHGVRKSHSLQLRDTRPPAPRPSQQPAGEKKSSSTKTVRLG